MAVRAVDSLLRIADAEVFEGVMVLNLSKGNERREKTG
jgi:hypothetical protein